MGTTFRSEMAAIMKIGKYSVNAFSLFLAGTIFFLPLVAAAEFSFRKPGGKGHSFVNYTWLLQQDGFWPALGASFRLAVLSGALNLILMVPTMVVLNLKAKRYKSIVDFICILPLIIPVVSLAIGAQVSMPEFLQNTDYELVFFFVIVALPYTYRALDSAISAVDIKVLVEASRSLGASWFSTIMKVIIPAIRTGIIGSLFLSFALAVGEFTLTSLLHWDTFPTWTVVAAQQNILGAIAISVFSFALAIFVLTSVGILSARKKSLNLVIETEEVE
jgi:putative spermidine/putrescine transport system permease protein